MALSILDGNQTATTLATTVSGSAHYPNHIIASGTVTANLGLNELPYIKANIAITKTGSSILTANVFMRRIGQYKYESVSGWAGGEDEAYIEMELKASGGVQFYWQVQLLGNLPDWTGNFAFAPPQNTSGGGNNIGNALPPITWTPATGFTGTMTVSYEQPSIQPISGTVTIGNTVTIAGTVTANPTGTQTIAGSVTIGAGTAQIGSVTASISGTVTANVGTILTKYTAGGAISAGYLPVGDSAWSGSSGAVMVMGGADDGAVPVHLTSMVGLALDGGTGSLPISGTVTIGNSVTIGALPVLLSTTTIGGTARLNVTLSSATTIGATAPSYGNLYGGSDGTLLRAISVDTSGRTVVTGTVSLATLPALVAGTAQIGSVTASLAISSAAITSGSFSSLTSATLVPANTARKMATVYNLGAGQLFINAGVTATTLGGGFMVALSSGDFYECSYTTTTLSAIFATAGTASWVSH